ncbi:ISAs1 family transposase (plasmid) [Streptomyces sp. NBC_01450]|nr:ISAs1 family transposase [Streptomyces sp. NBC_01450]
MLSHLDGDALDTAIGAFLTARAAEDGGTEGRLRAIAVDGKVLRGSRAGGKSTVTLPAAMDHNGSVLDQRQVADKSNEIPAFAPLLDTLDLNHTVITADALHTQHDHGRYLRRHGAHHLAVVKANHPGLFDQVRKLPWRDIVLDHQTRDRAHHRLEIHRLKTVAFAHIDYPDAAQVLQIVRWRRDQHTGKLTIERVHLITSLPFGAAPGAQLAAWIKGHWRIENLLHHVRDRTFREDDLQRLIELAQYTSRAFTEICRSAGVRQSMGAVGSSADNAVAESFNAAFKRETLKGRKGWSNEREARLDAFRWLTRYNTRRRHSHLGHRSPIAYENDHQAATTSLAKAA